MGRKKKDTASEHEGQTMADILRDMEKLKKEMKKASKELFEEKGVTKIDSQKEEHENISTNLKDDE